MASVRKRRWTYNGVAKEGWEVRWFDPETGKRPSKTFELKKQADAHMRRVEREIEDGTYLDREASLTIAEVCERYLTDAEQRWQRGEIGELHVIKIRRWVRLHIIPNIGRVVFKEIRASQIDELYHALCKVMIPSGARSILGFLKTVEKYANRHRYVLTNPIASALAGIRSAPAPRIRKFSIEEASGLLRLALEHRPGRKVRHGVMLGIIIHLAGCCGLRIGEILGLPWSQVDLDGGAVTIAHSLSGLQEIKGPKTEAGNRTVPLPAHLVGMLRVWRETHARPNEWDLVFTTTTGGKIHMTNMARPWHNLIAAAGIDESKQAAHFHALRHFAGSWWLHNGMTITDVSKLMGHATPAITMQVYAHELSSEADRSRAVADMGRKLIALPDARVTQLAA